VSQTCALSVLMFTGGSQFALVGILGAGGAGGAAIATAALLGVRNGFYALSMAPLLSVRGWRRPVAAQLTIDESTAVATAQLGSIAPAAALPPHDHDHDHEHDSDTAAEPSRSLAQLGFWSTGLSVFVLWNLTTLAGALAGTAVGDPRTYGLDAAAAAAFLALVWPRLHTTQPRLVALGSVLLAAALIPEAPAGVPVLASVLVALGGAGVSSRFGLGAGARHRSGGGTGGASSQAGSDVPACRGRHT
jgi:predicted branched-subunit amino acid permease